MTDARTEVADRFTEALARCGVLYRLLRTAEAGEPK